MSITGHAGGGVGMIAVGAGGGGGGGEGATVVDAGVVGVVVGAAVTEVSTIGPAVGCRVGPKTPREQSTEQHVAAPKQNNK